MRESHFIVVYKLRSIHLREGGQKNKKKEDQVLEIGRVFAESFCVRSPFSATNIVPKPANGIHHSRFAKQKVPLK